MSITNHITYRQSTLGRSVDASNTKIVLETIQVNVIWLLMRLRALNNPCLVYYFWIMLEPP
jgi:hypothetical protein